MSEYGNEVQKEIDEFQKVENITTEINKIINALTGVEVRAAIASALQKAYNDATSGGSGDTDLEVVLARGIYDALNKRLDANDDEVSNKAEQSEVDDLDNKKADKSALSQVAQSKRDKDVEIEMKDLSQGVKTEMTGGSVAVVGEDAVGTVNLKDNAVTSGKMSKDFMTKTPWLNSEDDDLDYVWEEGNYRGNSAPKNSPFPKGYFLKVERSRTTESTDSRLIRQTAVKSQNDEETEVLFRTLQVNISTGTIDYVKDWKKLLTNDSSITKEDLGRHSNMAFPWLSGDNFDLDDIWEPGTYMIAADVLNNPVEEIAILDVTSAKTSINNNNLWVKQEVTLVHVNQETVTLTRFLKANLSREVVDWKKDWKKIKQTSNSFDENNPYDGMAWVALGTSMTMLDKYTSYVRDELDLILDNRGVSSAGITSYASAGNATMQAAESIEDFKGIVSIELGPNDWVNCPLGELGDTDDDTWYGAVDKVCKTIISNTSARPFFITSTTTTFSTGANFDENKRRSVYYTNSLGHKYIEYVNAVKEVAQHYSIPVCDVFGESGLGYKHLNEETLKDHIHPTTLGGKIYGNHIVNFLKNKFIPFPSGYNNPLAD